MGSRQDCKNAKNTRDQMELYDTGAKNTTGSITYMIKEATI
jgi:hypothetical protein